MAKASHLMTVKSSMYVADKYLDQLKARDLPTYISMARFRQKLASYFDEQED